jgi:hypothetical protein
MWIDLWRDRSRTAPLFGGLGRICRRMGREEGGGKGAQGELIVGPKGSKQCGVYRGAGGAQPHLGAGLFAMLAKVKTRQSGRLPSHVLSMQAHQCTYERPRPRTAASAVCLSETHDPLPRRRSQSAWPPRRPTPERRYLRRAKNAATSRSVGSSVTGEPRVTTAIQQRCARTR